MKTAPQINTHQHGASRLHCNWSACSLAAAVLVGLLFWTSAAGAKSFDEKTVKAVFLYRLTLFVNWPASKMAVKDTPLVIGTIGAVSFASQIEEAVRGEQINGRPIKVQEFSQLSTLLQNPCDMLYVGAVDPDRLEAILSLAREKQILTISDTPRFAHSGGMVAIRTENRRMRIRINLRATRQAGITFSAKLLKVAELITREDP